MATYIQGIQTSVGVVKYDYNYLANLPESDSTLTKQGEFADALVTGRKFTQLNTSVNKLEESMTEVKQAISDLKSSDASTNTAIEQINTSLLNMTNNISEIKSSADTANTSITAMQKTIESLQTRIDALEKAQTK